MGQDALRDAGLVANLFEEDESLLQQFLGGNWVGSTLQEAGVPRRDPRWPPLRPLPG
jgi:hypothetical protein